MAAPTPPPDPSLRAVAGLLDARTDALVLTEGKDLGEALSSVGGLHFLDRVIALPVSDRATIAAASAVAWTGRPVLAELSDQRRLPAVTEALAEACRIAARADRPLSFVVRAPLVGGDGVAAACAVDGLRVWCASDRSGSLLGVALDAGGPVVVLEPIDAPDATHAPHEGGAASPAARVVVPGRRATIVTCGAAVRPSVEAAGRVGDVEVIDAVAISPLDPAIAASVRRTGRLVVVSGVDAAWADRVIQAALPQAFLYLEAPPARCAADVEAIVAAVQAAVSY